MPVVRTDGRSVARSLGHVITKFSGMGRFIYPWRSAGALRARSSAINLWLCNHHNQQSYSNNLSSHSVYKVSIQPRCQYYFLSWSEICQICMAKVCKCSFILPEWTIEGTAWISVDHLTSQPERRCEKLFRANLTLWILSSKALIHLQWIPVNMLDRRSSIA